MKMILGILIIIARLYIGFKILQWIVFEITQPKLHSISEIEIFLVFILLDVWINSQPTIEIETELTNRDN